MNAKQIKLPGQELCKFFFILVGAPVQEEKETEQRKCYSSVYPQKTRCLQTLKTWWYSSMGCTYVHVYLFHHPQ